MEENKEISSEVIYDLPCHKELIKLSMQTHTLNIILWAFMLICNIYIIANADNIRIAKLFMLLSAYFAVVRIVSYFKNRDGGKPYKRSLYQNNGNIPHNIITLGETNITTRNHDTGNLLYTSYDDIRFLAESKNLLALITNLKMVHIIDKNTLTGGSREDVIALLRQKCPKLKSRILTGIWGRILNILLCIVLVIGVLWSSAILLQIPQRLSGQLTNDLSYREIAAEFSEIGITISDQAMLESEEYDREYAQEYGDYYRENPDANKAFDLLCWEGWGVYDEQTWDWTPSTSGVYWFDMEVYRLNSIYSDFLLGIDAMNESLSFTGISEDYSHANMDSGSGTVNFSFVHEGQIHSLTAEFAGDWFDMNILYEVGAILAADQNYEDLWYAFDDGQGILLYYGTTEQVQKLEKLIDTPFHKALQSAITK